MSRFLKKLLEIFRTQVFILLYKHKYIVIFFIPLRLKNLLPYPSRHQYAIDLKPVLQSWGVKHVFMNVTVWEHFLLTITFCDAVNFTTRTPYHVDCRNWVSVWKCILSVLSHGILWAELSCGTDSSHGIQLVITFISVVARTLRMIVSHQWPLRIIDAVSLKSFTQSARGIILLCT